MEEKLPPQWEGVPERERQKIMKQRADSRWNGKPPYAVCGQCGVSCRTRAEWTRHKNKKAACRPKRGRPLLGEPPRNSRTKWHSLEFIRKNPEKHAAHSAFNNAIAKGLLERPDRCAVCGKRCVPDGHHSDYKSPLDVVWCCRQCHKLLDRERARHEKKKS